MNRAILMMGLVLSIAVLLTGTIVQTAEARGKPVKDDEPKASVKLSCNDRKDILSCKASSRQEVGPFDLVRPDGTNAKHYSGICGKTQPFSDPDKIMDGDYFAYVKECGTNSWYTFKVNVQGTQITSIVLVPQV